MAENIVRSLKPNTRHVNLSGKRLRAVPRAISLVVNLVVLELKNNSIEELPSELSKLVNLQVLNIGCNELKTFPEVVKSLRSLNKLHLFRNKIQEIKPGILGELASLVFLNLNDNFIKELPQDVERMEKLEVISLNHNQLTTLPSELCFLPNLKEIHATHNLLTTLPLELGFLESLERLRLSRNKIKELPELPKVPLRELYFEANPVLECHPVHSVQEEEVLSLKELTARFIMKDIKDKNSILRQQIRDFPAAREMLSQASRCAVCSDAFLNTWLECVQFLTLQQDIKIKKCSQQVIPVRALLCSYKCFNTVGHGYYGVAFP